MTSPGLRPAPLIMFSQAATIKWTSTLEGLRPPMARALPKTAADPPMSNFIISIMLPAPAFRLYPPESKVTPLPTYPIFGEASVLPGPLYLRWMNCGWVSAASPTAR